MQTKFNKFDIESLPEEAQKVLMEFYEYLSMEKQMVKRKNRVFERNKGKN